MIERSDSVNPEISFIVAVYNVERYVEECIRSLCAVRRKDIEVILVNDGSTDSSLDICKKYAGIDDRVMLISQENRGLPTARNSGMGAARGKWIAFIDGDDCIGKKFEQKIIPKMDNAADIIIFGYKAIKNGEVPDEWAGEDYYLNRADIENVRKGLLNRYYAPYQKCQNENILFSATWGKLYKKKWLEENRIDFAPQAPWGEDVIFSFKTYGCADRVKVVAYTGYFYRINALSMTQKYDGDVFEKYLRFMEEMKSLVAKEKDEEMSALFYDMVVKQYLTILRRSVFHPGSSYGVLGSPAKKCQ